jgi:hypothetical protein
MQWIICPSCRRKLMRMEANGGQVWIETKCSKSGCGKKVEIRLPHPLTGSTFTPAISVVL